MKRKFSRALCFLLALILSAGSALAAETGFNAGLQVEQNEDGTISVTIADSQVLHTKHPTLTIPCGDVDWEDVSVTLNGEQIPSAWDNTKKEVTFRVDQGGTYVIKEADGPAQQPEEETPTTPVTPVIPDLGKDPDTSDSQAGDSGASGQQPVDSSTLFADVRSGDWFKDAVDCVVGRGLFGGTGSGKFSPNADMTRAMVWTVLARLDGQDTSTGETWYSAGLAWAKERGVSDGSAPEKSITRQELVTMLWRGAGCPQASALTLAPFADGGEVASWAEQSMAWAVETGLVEGTDSGLLLPTATATRAQVAAILARFIAQ